MAVETLIETIAASKTAKKAAVKKPAAKKPTTKKSATKKAPAKKVAEVIIQSPMGGEITGEEIAEARSRMHFYGLGGYHLLVIQSDAAGDLYALSSHLSTAEHTNALLNAQIADLQHRLDGYTALDTLSVRVSAEATPLFPSVERIAVGRLGGQLTALVDIKQGSSPDRHRIAQWLRARTQDENLDVVYK